MDDVIAALADQQEELRVLVAGRDDTGLLAATRCAGWAVVDILLHLAQTNEAAVASVTGRLGDFRLGGTDPATAGDVDELAALAVEAERDRPPTEIRDRWLASAQAQVAAFEGGDPHSRVAWVAGDRPDR